MALDPRIPVVYRPEREVYMVYVMLGTTDEGNRLYRAEDGVHPVPPNGEAPAYMTVGADIARAIGEALAPRPEATERHLDDAIATRDRLLSLIESTWKSL